MSSTDRWVGESAPQTHHDPPVWRQSLVIGGLMLAMCLFGLFTRPPGLLAAFWPANAMLMAMMVRFPRWSTPTVWISAIAGYIVADLATGSGLAITVWLTAGNVTGAFTGARLFRRLAEEDRDLRRPVSVLYLFLICATAAMASAIIGGGAAAVYTGHSWFNGLAYWIVGEFVSDILLVPVILTAPRWRDLRDGTTRFARECVRSPLKLAPALVLLASVLVSLILGGPGAVLFPIPALLWCAISYSLFATALVTFLYCAWTLIAISMGFLLIHPMTNYLDETTSLRLGTAFLALGPLSLASINSARERLVKTLERAVNHDFLTDTLARRAFMRLGGTLVSNIQRKNFCVAVLMLDIDRFKNINDRYGHAAGDQVLVQFAETVSRLMREADLIGRLGGEEFAIVLPHIDRDDALAIAERIRSRVERTPMELCSGEALDITVSIGVSLSRTFPSSLEMLLYEADQALYRSKREGRNRSTVHAPHPLPAPIPHAQHSPREVAV